MESSNSKTSIWGGFICSKFDERMMYKEESEVVKGSALYSSVILIGSIHENIKKILERI